MNVRPKRLLTVRIDELCLRHAKSKPNVSRYIEGLVKQDFQMEQSQPLYEAVIEKLMSDDERLAKLAKRLNKAADKPVVRQGIIENPNWGA